MHHLLVMARRCKQRYAQFPFLHALSLGLHISTLLVALTDMLTFITSWVAFPCLSNCMHHMFTLKLHSTVDSSNGCNMGHVNQLQKVSNSTMFNLQ